MKSFKINEQFIRNFSDDQEHINTENIFLLPYEELNVCKFLKDKDSQTRILLHHFSHNNIGSFFNSLYQQENRIFQFTNIHDSIMKTLYPIQDDEKISSIITLNCKVKSLIEHKNINPFTVDIFSIDSLVAPKIHNLEILNGKFEHDNFADRDEYSAMIRRVELLVNYAISNNYQVIITGLWGLGIFHGPIWGIIQLWNNVLLSYNLKKYGIYIIFCIPVLEEKIYTPELTLYYDYFSEYLICSSPKPINMNIIKKQKEIKQELSKLSEKELEEKKVLRAMIWGSILGEVLYIDERTSQDKVDWDITTYFTHDLFYFLYKNRLKTEITDLLQYLSKSTSNNVQLKSVCGNESYHKSPIKFMKMCERSNKIYSANYIIPSIHIMSFYDINKSNLFLYLFNNDIYITINYLCVNFVLHNIYKKKYIKTFDLQNLYKKCMSLMDEKKYEDLKVEFDKAWSTAINYKFCVQQGIESYSIENNKFETMVYTLAILYDMYSFLIINNIKVVDYYDYIRISELDVKLEKVEINLFENLPPNYIFNKLEYMKKTCSQNTIISMGMLFGLVGPEEIDSKKQGESPSKMLKKKINKIMALDSCIDKFITVFVEEKRIKQETEFFKKIEY